MHKKSLKFIDWIQTKPFFPFTSTSPNSLGVVFSSSRFTRQTQTEDSFIEIVVLPTFETDVKLEKTRSPC